MVRTNDVDTCADVLDVARVGANKTLIVYQANLNFRIVEKYLQRLMGNGLLRETRDRRFLTTGKGVEFLKRFATLVLPISE